jgi:alpha-L-arabinofuranosidase
MCYILGCKTHYMTALSAPAHRVHTRQTFLPGIEKLMTVRRLLLLISLCASTTALGQAPLPIYLNNLENTFQNWSWIPNNFADTTYVLPGFANSISATANGDWQAISLGSDVVNAYQGLNLAPYQNLVFWANGGAAGGQKLQVFTGNFNGTGIGVTYSLPALTPNTWTQFTIPLSTICPAGTTNIDRFTFQLTPNGTTGTWYLGDIYLSPRPAPSSVNLSVDASQKIRTADPRWFGVNTAIYDGYLDTSFTSNAIAQAGLLSLRFPGGSESDNYNWSTSRSGGATFTWGTSFANLAHLATNAGTQVFTTVNYGSGSAAEAAAWVAYANGSPTNTLSLGTDQYGLNWHTAGYWAALRAAAPLGSDDGYNFLRISRAAPLGFKNWEIGNECYGTWETDSNTPPWSANTYATRFASYYGLMKAVDPTIKVGAVATPGEDSSANYTTYAATNTVTGQVHYGWTPVMLSTLKGLGVTPDFLIYHFYPEYSPQGDSDQLVLQISSQLAGDATNFRAMLTDYLGSSATNTELCITENNGEGDGRQSTSLVNALYVADTLGIVMKTEFNAYTFWDLRNGQDTTGNYDSTIYGWRNVGDNGCMYNQSSCYPTYYGLSMMQYLARPGSTTLSAGSSYALLTPYAARAADGSLRVLVINKDTNAVFAGQINLANFAPSSSATVYFYGQPQDNAAKNNLSLSLQQIAVSNYAPVSTQFTYAFPALSMTVFDFSPAAPSLTARPAAPGQFVFQLNGQASTPYVLQSSPDLKNWTPVSTNVLVGSTLTITNTVSPTPSAQFWRAVWVP